MTMSRYTSVLSLDHHGASLEGEGPSLTCRHSGLAVEVRCGKVYMRGYGGRTEVVFDAGTLRWHCFDIYAERLRSVSPTRDDVGVIALIFHDGVEGEGMLSVSSTEARADEHRVAAMRQMAGFFERAPATTEARAALRNRLRDALLTPMQCLASRLCDARDETHRANAMRGGLCQAVASLFVAHPDGDGLPWLLFFGDDPRLVSSISRVDMVFDSSRMDAPYRAVPCDGVEARGMTMTGAMRECAKVNGARWFMGPEGGLYDASETE